MSHTCDSPPSRQRGGDKERCRWEQREVLVSGKREDKEERKGKKDQKSLLGRRFPSAPEHRCPRDSRRGGDITRKRRGGGVRHVRGVVPPNVPTLKGFPNAEGPAHVQEQKRTPGEERRMFTLKYKLCVF